MTKNQQIVRDLLVWKLKSKGMKDRHSKEVEELYLELKSIVERTQTIEETQTIDEGDKVG